MWNYVCACPACGLLSHRGWWYWQHHCHAVGGGQQASWQRLVSFLSSLSGTRSPGTKAVVMVPESLNWEGLHFLCSTGGWLAWCHALPRGAPTHPSSRVAVW